MRPLISYYGGKQRMASKIVPLIPPHIVYCEPFAGGAAVFYAKPKPPVSSSEKYIEVLNDLNGSLIAMYEQAQRNGEQFSSFLKCTPYSRHWQVWANMVLESRTDDKKSTAVAKYISQNQGFGARGNPGFGRSVIKNKAHCYFKRTQSAPDACARLQGVCLDNTDAIKCIRYYDSPHTFFYIDPPYLGTWLGKMGQWSPENLKELVSCLNMVRGSFIVSGYDLGPYRLRSSVSKEFKASCTSCGTGRTGNSRNHGEQKAVMGQERTEIVWMRGPAAPVRKSLIPILQKQTCFTGPLLGPCPLPLKR